MSPHMPGAKLGLRRGSGGGVRMAVSAALAARWVGVSRAQNIKFYDRGGRASIEPTAIIHAREAWPHGPHIFVTL